MTISSSTRSAGPYTGTGLLVAYPFSFKVFQASDVLVVKADTSNAQTTMALGTDYTVALSYVGQTIGARLLETGASPRSLGATGDGVADDTTFITNALLYSKTLDLRNRTWKITSSITLPAGTVLDMRGANIVLATG